MFSCLGLQKEKLYTQQITSLKKNEEIVINSAYCRMCKDTITSRTKIEVIYCECKNIGVGGAKEFIHHKYKDESSYRNRTIVKINGVWSKNML